MMNRLISTDSLTREAYVSDWRNTYHHFLTEYEGSHVSFIPELLPEFATKFDVFQVLDILQKRLGTETLLRALNPNETIASPLAENNDSQWLKKSNMVGVNIRTIGSFWNVVGYALTLPNFHDSIHLLPIWEPGVVGSLYGKVSWNINGEFYSWQLQQAIPWLDNVEKQLKVVVNVLHALGKTVGLDVIPHTDRFSEIVLIHPLLFEWVRRDGGQLIDHSENVWQEVEEIIWQQLHLIGTADGSWLTYAKEVLFDPDIPLLSDKKRQEVLFGFDQQQRLYRRLTLMQILVNQGYETLPMTMAPPYRGLHINPDVSIIDERGTPWYQYEFDHPQAMSRVFGPLTRYRFYHSKNNNQEWELDFDRPNLAAWHYFTRKYHECQQQFNFDFMRGDMAHVQMRADGVPVKTNAFYDPLCAVKKYVQHHGAPHFAFYAETFIAPPDVMGYGNELDHLEAIGADATLGDLQASIVGEPIFMERFAEYDQLLRTRRFAPSFTIITADKDDPRFDEFYQTGNLVRYFIGLFLTDMPSYYSLGFEVRNRHEERDKNEKYTKLYVFQIHDDAETDKVTHGPFEWGENMQQFQDLTHLRLFAESIWKEIADQEIRWILPPDATAKNKLIAWTQANQPTYIFVANLDSEHEAELKKVPLKGYQLVFETAQTLKDKKCMASSSGRVYKIKS
ncbi:hypothetical protein [Runella sp.]|uniref:hypothetical protein n=1 Tax=Runella sp. TaxID=1960881 RepID=UPI00260CE8C4|nr:hypothetical protein [Runella sp.]